MDDEVLVYRNDKLIPVKVIAVSSLIMQGIYFLVCLLKIFC